LQLRQFFPKRRGERLQNLQRAVHGIAASQLLTAAAGSFADGDWFGGFVNLADASANLYMMSCFAAGTPLRTPGGHQFIENFRPGDLILTRSEVDPEGALEAKEVEEVFVNLAPIVHLHVGGQVIRTTGEHPFFEKKHGWVPANTLKPGDWLASLDRQWVAVEEVFETGEYETVYNLRVAEYHTYFIGTEDWGFSVWAHNAYNPTKAEKDNPYLAGETPQPGSRSIGVKRAAKLEIELVQRTGKGTSNWTSEQIAHMQNTGTLPPNTVGHHINNVSDHPNWAGDPRNVVFVNGQAANLLEHGGCFQNRTTGPLIDRPGPP
jgi:hypothetical protein